MGTSYSSPVPDGKPVTDPFKRTFENRMWELYTFANDHIQHTDMECYGSKKTFIKLLDGTLVCINIYSSKLSLSDQVENQKERYRLHELHRQLTAVRSDASELDASSSREIQLLWGSIFQEVVKLKLLE